MKRKQIFEELRKKPEVPVLIIGAGVNGIGTFRDLSLQGVDTLIVDRADFCSGASSASSHMAHGGIRYLENGEFRLVREAVKERNHMIQNMPHLVKPLPTTIPMFKWLSGLMNAPLKFMGLLDRPSERGAVVIKIGLIFYDAFTGAERTVPRHEFRLRKESLAMFPKLSPQITCTARYFDGNMPSPERICMELIGDALEANPGSKALNYVRLAGSDGQDVILHDELTGDTLRVKPQVIVNAAGPWIDFTNKDLHHKTQFIGGTKGSHIVVENSELRQAIGENEFFFENKDGRIVLLFPLEDKVLIGTSDIKIDDPDQARCTDEEVQYFIDMVKVVFPAIHIDPSQIIFAFSGVRPLPYADVNFTGQISRDHSIEVLEPQPETPYPILNLIGGKWTSFRAFSEQVTDRVLDYLEVYRHLTTENTPIGGGAQYPKNEKAEAAWVQGKATQYNLDETRMSTLFKRYGTHAERFASFISAGDDVPLASRPDFSLREVLYIVQNENVIHLDDFLLRRSMLAKLGLVNHALLEELAPFIGVELGWDEKQQQEEIDRAVSIFTDEHLMTV